MGCIASTEDSLLAFVTSGSGLPSLDKLSGVYEPLTPIWLGDAGADLHQRIKKQAEVMKLLPNYSCLESIA